MISVPIPRLALLSAALSGILGGSLCGPAAAQAPKALAPVTVTAQANRNPVEKSYRKMIRGMDLFEQKRAMSPDGVLRFKLLPRKPDTDMDAIDLNVVGNTQEFPLPIAADHTFTLQRDRRAWDDDAQVIPNRKAQSMTWRTEIRTPGLPPGTRRLGDLRLECQVGMEAGLVSDGRTLVGRFATALLDTPAYCERVAPQYLFFAERPLFGVTLVSGARREALAIDRLYAGLSEDPGRSEDLSYCDCEVLLDRAYFLPLGDRSWPDDTLVEFEYMEGS